MALALTPTVYAANFNFSMAYFESYHTYKSREN